MEKLIPRKIDSVEQMQTEFPGLVNEKRLQTADINSINNGILSIVYDLYDRGGKRWRPALGLMIAEAFGKNVKNYEESKSIYYV